MNANDLTKILSSRAASCVKQASPFLDFGEYYLGGSCIASNEIRDIDVYPAGEKTFIVPLIDILTRTKNATTISHSPILQFCNYKKPDLTALISSFDFAHIQAGAHISSGKVVSVKWTESFMVSRACGTSSFEESDYPLSSLIRLLKYHKRGDISDRSSVVTVLKILSAIVNRGFKGYDDFKDQLDAVDLGLVPEQIEELDGDLTTLCNLFARLDRGN